jgi:hypothetical protein
MGLPLLPQQAHSTTFDVRLISFFLSGITGMMPHAQPSIKHPNAVFE